MHCCENELDSPDCFLNVVASLLLNIWFQDAAVLNMALDAFLNFNCSLLFYFIWFIVGSLLRHTPGFFLTCTLQKWRLLSTLKNI